MIKALIHHAEIGLKKGNFNYFETKLVENIKKAAEKNKIKINKITRQEKRIICDFDSNKEEEISSALKKVFGISFFSFISEINKDIKEIEQKVMEIMKDLNIKKIAFKTKRSDKSFPLTSIEINVRFGEIANKLGLKVDYSNPDKTIFLEITSKKAYIYTERISGFGGLPVGTSGKVLCLLSGGIDSPVASWLMMKRGCTVDFLHFHTYKNNEEAFNSKLRKIIDVLNEYQGQSTLFLIPYSNYEVVSQGQIEEKYDLILFKYYMLKLTDKFTLENNYDAIVTGDNLGQVASQTMENLKATSFGVEVPIFRPLLTYDKQEIVDLAKQIGTYSLSVEKYKDCCSILAKKPSTKTKLELFKKIVKDFNVDDLIDKSVNQISKFRID